jgi:hypothetical protein
MEYVALSQEGREAAGSDAFMRQVAAAAEMSGENYAEAGALYFRARALAMVLTRDSDIS